MAKLNTGRPIQKNERVKGVLKEDEGGRREGREQERWKGNKRGAGGYQWFEARHTEGL